MDLDLDLDLDQDLDLDLGADLELDNNLVKHSIPIVFCISEWLT